MSYAEELLRELNEKEQAEKAVARATPYVRAAIAKLEAPWSVCISGLEVIRPPEGDRFTPFRVCLERFDGNEHKVVAYPAARTESEARTMAEAECSAGRAAYAAEGWKLVEEVLRAHGAWEAHLHLRNLKLIQERERDERRRANETPVAVVLGRAEQAPPAPPNWTDEGKRAAALAPRSTGDFARILPQPAKKQAQRVINPEAPSAEELAERARAKQNKF
jgi:hypothetical protein